MCSAKNTIVIIHKLPIEFYPPVTNFIDYLSNNKKLDIHVFSTKNNKNRKVYSAENVSIERTDAVYKQNILFRFLKSIREYFKVTYKILSLQPDVIIYYESSSAGLALLPILYKRKTKLCVINHEYFAPAWYKNTASKIIRINHFFEKRFLFKRARFITQTNDDRKDLFLKDHKYLSEDKIQIMPNYPTKDWIVSKKSKKNPLVLKTVYIGTLSLEYSYVEEYCNWVINQKGSVTLDLYSYNLNETTESYISKLNSPFIKLIKGGVEYNDIPKVLKLYDVGLVLYKAITINYKYNAPNKVFEYLACGLDVWASNKLITVNRYLKTQSFPKIIQIDFEKLKDFDWQNAYDKSNYDYLASPYFYESVYSGIYSEITNE